MVVLVVLGVVLEQVEAVAKPLLVPVLKKPAPVDQYQQWQSHCKYRAGTIPKMPKDYLILYTQVAE